MHCIVAGFVVYYISLVTLLNVVLRYCCEPDKTVVPARKGKKIMKYRMVAPCYFGCEAATAFDVRSIGAEDVQVTDGRVAFTGDEMVLARANLRIRSAERVLVLLKTWKVTTFDELFDGVASIAWENLMPAEAEFPVKGSSLSSTLSSVPACQSIVKKAVVERLKKGHHVTTLPENGNLYKIRFSIRKDIAEIFLDTSGEGLHKRGYRRNSTLAPIKETLAATIIDVAHLRFDSLVVDPFCGSGTILIEAAMKAMHMAPGLRRTFLAEHYDFIPASVWREARAQELAQVRSDVGFRGIGFDIDPEAVAIANRNAKLAGVADKVQFFVADVKDFEPAGNAVVITNPPYGERLGDAAQAAALEKVLGQRLADNPVQSAFIITSDADFEQNFGRRADKRRKLYNGMLPCQLYMYFAKKGK